MRRRLFATALDRISAACADAASVLRAGNPAAGVGVVAPLPACPQQVTVRSDASVNAAAVLEADHIRQRVIRGIIESIDAIAGPRGNAPVPDFAEPLAPPNPNLPVYRP